MPVKTLATSNLKNKVCLNMQDIKGLDSLEPGDYVEILVKGTVFEVSTEMGQDGVTILADSGEVKSAPAKDANFQIEKAFRKSLKNQQELKPGTDLAAMGELRVRPNFAPSPS